MPIVTDDDIQIHLPVDKLKLEDVPDSVTDAVLDAERVIKGRLSGVYAPLTLAAWASPETTPQHIRAIGGRLAAALIYSTRLSGERTDIDFYAQGKYNEAMNMLELVATGQVTLPEVTEIIDTGARLSINHFTALPDPKFAMDSEF
jgi:hypothetical protein